MGDKPTTKPVPKSTFNESNTSRGKLLRMGLPSGLAPKGPPTTKP